MLLTDFQVAGITGVTAANLAAINQVLSTKTVTDSDTNPKLQAIVDGVVAAIAKVENYNNVANGVTTLTTSDYAAAGIVGVNAANLANVNSAVLALSAGGADTHAEIQAVASAIRIKQLAEAVSQGSLDAPTLADYQAVGSYAVNTDNLSMVNGFVLQAATGLADNAGEIRLLVQEALEIRQHFKAFADSAGTSAAPTAQDYTSVGVSGVSVNNLLAVNKQLAVLGTGHGDTVSQIQVAVTNGNAALARIEDYNNGANGVTTLTVADYTNAGVVGVTEGNLRAVNFQVRNSASGGADSNPELATLATAAIAAVQKIEDYNNGTNGVTNLTVQDYVNAGIVNVTAGNLSEVNAQVLSSASGAADTCDEIQGLVALSKISAYALDSTLQRPDGISRPFFPNNLTSNGTNDANSAFTYAGWATGGFEPYFAFDGRNPAPGGAGVIESASYPAVIGWRDISAGAAPNFLKEITLTARSTWASRFPKTWTVEGYTADTQQWVELKAFNLSSNPNSYATQTYAVDSTRLCTGYRLKFTAAFTPSEPLNLAEIGANVQGVETRTLPTLEEYQSAGITGLDAHSMYAMNAVVDAFSPSGVQPLSAFTALVQDALNMKAAALTAVHTYASTGGAAPTLEVYLKAGALGMTSAHLNAVNARVEALSGVADIAALNSAATAGIADQVARLAVSQNYLNGVANAPMPTLDDYLLAGFSSVASWGEAAVAVANLYLQNLHDAGSMTTDYSAMFNKLSDLSNALTDTYDAVYTDRSTHTTTSFDTAPEQAALKQAVLKYAAIVQMDNLADYAAQGAVQLTAADINLLLGDSSTFATSANLNDIIAHIAHETVLPKSTVTDNYTEDQAKFYELTQVIKSDAFVESVVRNAQNDPNPTVVVRLVDATAGDKLELYIDGSLISIGGSTQFDITSQHVVDGKITFGNNEVFLTGKDTQAPSGRYDYSVKVVHDGDPNTPGLQPSATNPTVESEAWRYTYG
jgi:hypothetical protein